MPQRLPKDVTIEEIAELIQSLNPTDMDELLNSFLDTETKEKLKALL